MDFFLLTIGAMLGFMLGYLMGFCKADTMHHKITHDRWIGGYTPIARVGDRPTPPSKE